MEELLQSVLEGLGEVDMVSNPATVIWALLGHNLPSNPFDPILGSQSSPEAYELGQSTKV